MTTAQCVWRASGISIRCRKVDPSCRNNDVPDPPFIYLDLATHSGDQGGVHLIDFLVDAARDEQSPLWIVVIIVTGLAAAAGVDAGQGPRVRRVVVDLYIKDNASPKVLL